MLKLSARLSSTISDTLLSATCRCRPRGGGSFLNLGTPYLLLECFWLWPGLVPSQDACSRVLGLLDELSSTRGRSGLFVTPNAALGDTVRNSQNHYSRRLCHKAVLKFPDDRISERDRYSIPHTGHSPVSDPAEDFSEAGAFAVHEDAGAEDPRRCPQTHPDGDEHDDDADHDL